MSHWETALILHTQIHNIAAFTLHIIPLMYLWERLIGVHEKPNRIRLPWRTVPLLLVWLLAVMLPFYGNVSSVYSSITGFLVTHVFPGLAFSWFYRWAAFNFMLLTGHIDVMQIRPPSPIGATAQHHV